MMIASQPMLQAAQRYGIQTSVTAVVLQTFASSKECYFLRVKDLRTLSETDRVNSRPLQTFSQQPADSLSVLSATTRGWENTSEALASGSTTSKQTIPDTAPAYHPRLPTGCPNPRGTHIPGPTSQALSTHPQVFHSHDRCHTHDTPHPTANDVNVVSVRRDFATLCQSLLPPFFPPPPHPTHRLGTSVWSRLACSGAAASTRRWGRLRRGCSRAT